MQQGLSSVSDPSKFTPLNWTLNIATQEFSYDKEAAHHVLLPDLAVDTFDDWLELMSPLYRRDVEQLLESVCVDDNRRTCIVALWGKPDHGLYLSFSAEKLSQYVVQGEMQLIFEVNQDQQSISWFDFLLRQDNCGLLVTNSDNKILACNRRFEQLSGFKLVELFGLNSILLFEEDPAKLDTDKPSDKRHFAIKHSSGELKQCRATSISLSFIHHPEISLTIFSLSPSIKHSTETSILTKKEFCEQLDVIYRRKIANTMYVVMTLNVESSNEQFQNTLGDVMARLKECRMFGKLKDNLYLACIKCFAPENEKPYRYIHRQMKHFFQELKSVNTDIYQLVAKGKVGISVLGVDVDNAKAAITHSVQAILEQSSEERGQHIRFFNSELHRQIKKRKLLEELVADVIQTKQGAIKYLPIVNTQSWQIAGYEAQFDFSLPSALSSTPKELESIIQDLNLCTEFDIIVQEKVLQELPLLLSYHSLPITVTVNIMSQYEPHSFVNVLSSFIRKMRGNNVSLEHINLQVKPEILNAMAEQDIEMLQHLGIKFVIDNVDIDHVVTNRVVTERCNFIKLNSVYLTSLTDSPMIHPMLKTLMDGCHAKKVAVAIEGVKNIDDAKLLSWLGMDYLSGDIFSDAESIDNIQSVVEKVEEMQSRFVSNDIAAEKTSAVGTLQNLCHGHTPHLDPSDTVAVAHQYFLSSQVEVLPVINRKECVGVIDRACLNLHLTPHMGTDLETTQENAMWHRPVNQIMRLSFTKLDAKTDLSRLSQLINDEHKMLPWVMTEGKTFKGIITSNCIMQYFASANIKPGS